MKYKDILCAGIIFAFNIDVPKQVAELAQTKNVPIQRHNVIYKLFDKLKQELTNVLPPALVETTEGRCHWELWVIELENMYFVSLSEIINMDQTNTVSVIY